MNSTSLMDVFTNLFGSNEKVTLKESELIWLRDVCLFPDILAVNVVSSKMDGRIVECRIDPEKFNAIDSRYDKDSFTEDIVFILSLLAGDGVDRKVAEKFVDYVVSADSPLFTNEEPHDIMYVRNDIILKVIEGIKQ